MLEKFKTLCQNSYLSWLDINLLFVLSRPLKHFLGFAKGLSFLICVLGKELGYIANFSYIT